MTHRDSTVTQRLSRTEIEIETERETESSVPRYARNGAAAPLGANEVVAAYVRGRDASGLTTDARLRGMCGRYARQLLAARSWDRDTLLEAVERFAATKRSPRFLSEWASQIVTEREVAEHKARKEAEPVRADRGMRSISEILRGAA